MKKFNVKFFGSKNSKEQITKVKMEIEAESQEQVKEKLRYLYGYKVINGLKIR
jgi:hypothetical protein